MRWLASEHPYALPRVNTADAVPPPRDGREGARRGRPAGGARGRHTHPARHPR